MSWRREALAIALLLCGLAGCSDSSGQGGMQGCRIEPVADLPMLQDVRLPAVRARYDNHDVVLLIDTGAQMSSVSEEAENTFAFEKEWDHYVRINGINGMIQAPVVDLDRLDLGHGVARDIRLPVAGRFGRTIDGMPVLGLFGADFLSNYDVEIDEPAHHFAIYKLYGCGSASLQPFDPPIFSIPFHIEDSRIVLDLALNGQPLRALLDSGAMRTLITRDDAHRVGVTDAELQADPKGRAMGVDLHPLEVRLHRFAQLRLGSEVLSNVPLTVAEGETNLIGGDVLQYNRVWISYPRRRVYIQPVIPPEMLKRPS